MKPKLLFILLVALTILALPFFVLGQASHPADPVIGDENAPITFEVFSNFQCPFCARFQLNTFNLINENYIKTNKVKAVFRNYPLTSVHKFSQAAAEASECAYEQGAFFEMQKRLFSKQSQWTGEEKKITKTRSIYYIKKYAKKLGLDTKKFNKCLVTHKYKKEITRDLLDGQSAGVSGTPAFLINGKLFSGALPYETVFKAIFEAELAGKNWSVTPEGVVSVEEPAAPPSPAPPAPAPVPPAPPAPPSPPAIPLSATHPTFSMGLDSPGGATLIHGADKLLAKIKVEASDNSADGAINKVFLKTIDVYMENVGVSISSVRLYPAENDLDLSFVMPAVALSPQTLRFDLSGLAQYKAEINEREAKVYVLRANVDPLPAGARLQFFILNTGDPGSSGLGGTATGDLDSAPDIKWSDGVNIFYWTEPRNTKVPLNPAPLSSGI